MKESEPEGTRPHWKFLFVVRDVQTQNNIPLCISVELLVQKGNVILTVAEIATMHSFAKNKGIFNHF